MHWRTEAGARPRSSLRDSVVIGHVGVRSLDIALHIATNRQFAPLLKRNDQGRVLLYLSLDVQISCDACVGVLLGASSGGFLTERGNAPSGTPGEGVYAVLTVR